MQQNVKHRTELIKLLPPDAVCAEVGVAEGYNSADMLAWGISRLYMVDMWETSISFPGDSGNDQRWHDINYKAARDRVEKYGGKAVILRGASTEMAMSVEDESLDLLYLDACHSYRCVMDDLQAWFSKVKVGGVIAGHDYLAIEYGVYQAVQDFTRGKFQVETIPENKKEDAGFYFIKS